MENPINQEETEASTKEPVKAEEPAASNSGERSDGATSPPPNCSICLGKLINTSFTDSCLHQFCFTCLLQWSRIKTECPLCKQTFKSIIHNVRSEEDYDQYHVPREAHLSTQATGSFAATLAFSNASMSAYQRFAYRTTMTPSRRYGRLFASLHPNSSHHTRQGLASVSTSQLPTVSQQERRQRRNIYRTGEWSDPVPDVYSRFRQCSAEYYRRYPHEINRLIPWINRDLQTIFNPEQTPIAYVLSVITDMLTQYDMRSPEFRNAIRPYLQLETDHFIHELMNYASSDLSMSAYDATVTYFNSFPSHGLTSTGYWHHVQSQTSSSTSSTISDDSDVRVVDHVDPSGSEIPSVGPHLINIPGPSTVSQAMQLQSPQSRPFVLTITSSSSESECEIVGYVKPRCERTPEIIELMSSGEEEIVAACSNSIPDIESPRSSSLSPVNDQPSTSESRRLKTSKSKASTRQLDRLALASNESSSDSDADSQTKKPPRSNSKHSKASKPSKSTRKSSPKKNELTKKRSKHNYSSSDSSSSPRESKCRRTSLNSSRSTARAYVFSSDSEVDQTRNNDEFKITMIDNDNSKTTCRVRVRNDLINSSKKKHKRRTKRSSSTSSSTSSSSSESDSSNSTSTSLTTSSSYKHKANKSRKKKRSKSKRGSKHKTDNLHGRHRSRSRSRSRSKSRSSSRSRSREILSDASGRYSVIEKFRERKAAKIANKRLKNKHLYAMTDSQNDEEAYRSNSQCSSISDRHKTSKASEKKYSNAKTKSHKTKSHKKSSSKAGKKQKRLKTRENEKRPRRRITSSSSSSSFSSSSSKY